MTIDLMEGLRDVLKSVDLTPEDSGGSIEFIGADPIVPSKHRLGALSALTMTANAVAVAAVWKMRTGEGQDLTADLKKTVFGLGSTSFGVNAFRSTLNGYEFPFDGDSPNPIRAITEFHELKDGRWGSINAHFRHMLFDWLDLLKCSPYPESVIAAVKTWNSEDILAAAVERKLCYAPVLSKEEWANEEQGQIQHNTPVIDLTKIGNSAPEPLGMANRPLAGIRVLGCTHAVAGAIVGRTLAEQGADVLYLHSPRRLETEAVYDSANVGTRSTFVDLKTKEGIEKAKELLKTTDIFVENQREGALARLGLSDDDLMALRPGIIIVRVRAFGNTGPWATRPGNDRQGTAASGVGVTEGGDSYPRLPPCKTTNDYMTGMQGAAGATAALVRRAKEGGSYKIGVSLVRSSMWLGSLGVLDDEEAKAEGWQERLIKVPSLRRPTALGELYRPAPLMDYSKTPAAWTDPILVPRGSQRPEWLPTA